MPAPKPKTLPRARGWTVEKVCAYIGMSVSWWHQGGLKELKKADFPEPSGLTGRYDRALVRRWYDRHSGIAAESATKGGDAWGEGLNGLRGKHGASAH